ncbi:hypothetical protein [Nitratireductor sp. ZSWI3]|uniref:DUF6958 family protein n=1 Tax=Nitratireductor sp. ZSWI3 TaxID=2966359 RepID=UPI00214FD4CE|nr:hypothetical protein [Nitratireductor sp. ZSWI3]MCR4268560.1 hypothetical protein [Nitratireductor sp. ZSWI3]
MGETIVLQNPNHPNYAKEVDADMYEAMKAAFLKVLPKTTPGLTYEALSTAVLPLLPDALFPGGAKAGWYMKAVQMDLEAKGIIKREKTRPLRLHKV